MHSAYARAHYCCHKPWQCMTVLRQYVLLRKSNYCLINEGPPPRSLSPSKRDKSRMILILSRLKIFLWQSGRHGSAGRYCLLSEAELMTLLSLFCYDSPYSIDRFLDVGCGAIDFCFSLRLGNWAVGSYPNSNRLGFSDLRNDHNKQSHDILHYNTCIELKFCIKNTGKWKYQFYSFDINITRTTYWTHLSSGEYILNK